MGNQDLIVARDVVDGISKTELLDPHTNEEILAKGFEQRLDLPVKFTDIILEILNKGHEITINAEQVKGIFTRPLGNDGALEVFVQIENEEEAFGLHLLYSEEAFTLLSTQA